MALTWVQGHAFDIVELREIHMDPLHQPVKVLLHGIPYLQ